MFCGNDLAGRLNVELVRDWTGPGSDNSAANAVGRETPLLTQTEIELDLLDGDVTSSGSCDEV